MIDCRYDRLGPLTLLAQAEIWAMVRRPGAMPFVLSLEEWERLPACRANGRRFSANKFGVFDLKRTHS
jgi:hypothetical protein